MDEKEFKALEKIYNIRLQRAERQLEEKRRLYKLAQDKTQACIQKLREEEALYQEIGNQINDFIGRPIKPGEIVLWRSRQARQRHAISEASTQVREAEGKERAAGERVKEESKSYQIKLLRRDSFRDAVLGSIQKQKQKQASREEERELDL